MNLSPEAVEWLANGQRGISSNAIFTHLTGVDAMGRWTFPGSNHPSDPDDLHRCRLLLERCPELRAELPRMATRSKVWARLVAEWDALCAMLDEEAPEWRQGRGSAPRTYARMNEIGC